MSLASYDGSFAAVADAAAGSAVALAQRWAAGPASPTARAMRARAPVPQTGPDRRRRPAARRCRAFADLDRLTMFADNLVPTCSDSTACCASIPDWSPGSSARELIEHGSPEEVEIRACALHAVELIVAARGPARAPPTSTSSCGTAAGSRATRPRRGTARAARPTEARLRVDVFVGSEASARVRAIASAPASPTSNSGRRVPLAMMSSAGKRPMLGQPHGPARSRSSRRRSAALAVAITVSEPPSTMLRAAASALRAVAGCSRRACRSAPPRWRRGRPAAGPGRRPARSRRSGRPRRRRS